MNDLGKYKENKQRAKAINDLEETGRLLLIGSDRHRKMDDEVKVQQFIKNAKEAKTYLVSVMEEEHYGKRDDTLASVKNFQVKDLDDCHALGEKILTIHKEIKKHAGINGLFYPFFPASTSRLSIASLDLLIGFAVAALLFFLL